MSAELEKDLLSGENPFGNASAEEIAVLDRQLAEDEKEFSADLNQAGGRQEAADDTDDDEPEQVETKQPEAKAPEASGKPDAQKPQDQKPDPAKPEATKQPVQKPLSPYEEAKRKAQEREARAWQKIEAEKKAIADREAALKLRELELGRKANAPATQQAEADPMNDPKALEAAAEKFEREGKFDLADVARERAEELRKNPPKNQSAQQQQGQQPAVSAKSVFEMQPHEVTLSGLPKAEVSRMQNELYAQAWKEMPDVVKQGTELNQKFLALARENQEAFHFPKGPYMLAKMVHLEASASRLPLVMKEVEAKNTEIQTLQKRIKELERLTSPGGGDLTDPNLSEKSFDQMSLDEQERELERLIRS